MNPVRSVEMEAIRAANFLMNHDANGGEWIRFSRCWKRSKAAGPLPRPAPKRLPPAGAADGPAGGRGARAAEDLITKS